MLSIHIMVGMTISIYKNDNKRRLMTKLDGILMLIIIMGVFISTFNVYMSYEVITISDRV